MPKHKGHGSKPEWFTETGEVKQPRLLSVERALFVDWLSVPESERIPKGQNAFAKELGVSKDTLTAWKKDPRIMSQVRSQGQAAVISSFSEVTGTLLVIATDPEHKSAVAAARLLFEMLEKGEKAIDTIPLADMTDKEMKELMAEMYDVFDARSDASETA
jgi:hypothetical protein